jgi:hypothetical protein
MEPESESKATISRFERLLVALARAEVNFCVVGGLAGILKSLSEMGSAGNLPAPVGNLPTGTVAVVASETGVWIVHRRPTPCVRQVAGRDRLVACATRYVIRTLHSALRF